jgi:putative ABC transport system permease protein
LKALNLFQLSVKNLRHRPLRTVAVALCLGLVIAAFFSESLLVQGVDRSVEVGVERLGADILVVPKGEDTVVQNSLLVGAPISFFMNADKQHEVAGIPGVERTSAQLFVASLAQASCCSGSFQLIAFNPETDFTVTPWMKESLNRPLGKDEVVVGIRIFQQVGEELTFYGHKFMVAAKLSSTGTSMDKAVFLSFGDAYTMAEESKVKAEKPLVLKPDMISAITVKVKSGFSASMVAQQIMNSVKGVSVVTGGRFGEVVQEHLSGVLEGMAFVAGSFWVVSVLLIGVVFWMAVNERRREIGLLRAIGATGRFVFKMVLTESTLLTFIGGLLGIIGGGVVIYSFSLLISKSLDVPYLWPTFIQLGHMIGISLGIAVLTGLVASFIPALVSSRMEPLHAIRTEQ